VVLNRKMTLIFVLPAWFMSSFLNLVGWYACRNGDVKQN